jgi:PII-like signaling protein
VKIEGKAKAVAVFIGESDRWHNESLHSAIVERAHQEGIAGATVFQGIMGFGANSVIHRPAIFRLSPDLPILIYMVDLVERIDPFMDVLHSMVKEGMIATWEVQVERHMHSEEV